MRKDPTEFRKRFQSWKLGIPAYEDGKPIDYTKVAQESRDREYNTAMSYFKSTPNILNLAKGVYHFAKSTPLFGDTPASVNPNMIYGDAPAVGYRNATNLAETTRRIKAAVKPFVNGVSNTKLSTQALQQEIRYGDTYYPEQLTIAERNAMPKLRQSKLSKLKDKYVMVDNAPKVGLKNYILMENGRPLAEMIASMEDGSIIPEMVYKTNKAAHHTTTDLYSGILKYQKQAGNTGGIISGESYKSAPSTFKQVKKFKKEKISDNGVWDNEGLVGYGQEPTVVKTMEEADKLNKKGKAFILYNLPIYRLLQPMKDIPIKDRYMFDPRRIGPNGEYNIDMSNPSRFAQNQDDSNQRHYFMGGKDLPKFDDGVDLGSNPTNANINSDGTFTDDYTKALEQGLTVTGKRPLPEYRSAYDPNAIRMFTDWLPGVGDIGQGLDAYNAFNNQDYLQAGLLGGMLLLPNALEKPLKGIGKYLKNFDYSDVTSRLNKNIRTSLANNKSPFAYNIFDPNNIYPFIEGFTKTLRGKDIDLIPIREVKKEVLNRNIAWRKYLGLDSNDDLIDSFSGVNFGPYVEHKPGVFSVRPKSSDIKEGFDLENVNNLLLHKGKFIKDSALGNHGVMSHSVLGALNKDYPAMLHYWDTWDLLPFLNIKILPKSIRDFEVSKIIPGAKPFKYEGYAPMSLRQYDEYLLYLKDKPEWDKIKIPDYGGNAVTTGLIGGSLITPPALYGMIKGTEWLIDKALEFAKEHDDFFINYRNGKDIYIKPSHRGRLTALKKHTGKSEAELYKTGGPAVRKMITFARNARKWKH